MEDIPVTIDFSGNVSDVDTTLERLSIVSTSPFVTHIDGLEVTFVFPNGITSAKIELALRDERNNVRTVVEFRIQPVNDPPTLLITSPANHSVFRVGTSIMFSAHVTDPEIITGQRLTIEWISNISGLFMNGTSEEFQEFGFDGLPLGRHRIIARVSDGQYDREAWLDMEIIEDAPPTPTKDDPHFLTEPTNILLLILIIMVLINVTLYLYRNRRSQEKEEEGMLASNEDVTVDLGNEDGK
jgi:cbb3-type cytochrome oxidase subunit 3